MFETYQFSGVYVAIQAVLTLYAQGRWSLTFSIINSANICYMYFMSEEFDFSESFKSQKAQFHVFIFIQILHSLSNKIYTFLFSLLNNEGLKKLLSFF